MKLAEALMIRADLQRRIGQMRARIDQNARYQEGEEPTEDASSLIEEVSDALDELEELVLAVNLTNASLLLPDGRTMTAALAKRETLRARHSLLTSAADAAQAATVTDRCAANSDSSPRYQWQSSANALTPQPGTYETST